MAARKGVDETGNVARVLVLHGQRRHLQPDRPSFSARLDRRHVSRGKRLPGHLPEKGGHFILPKAQVGRAQLVQLPASTQTAERKGRIDAA